MTENITLSWQSDRPAETHCSSDSLVERLVEITRGTTVDNGIAAVVAKPSGQEMVVIVAGPCWCLDWFPEDYMDRGCVGSYHTIGGHTEMDDEDIVTYYIQGRHSECWAGHTVEKDEAIQAIRTFLATPERPDCVQWDMD